MQRDRKGHDLIMLRDVLIVMRGTVVAGLIGLLVLPLLTRLFTPEAFGHLQLYQSFLLLLIVIPTLRYDIAILRAENEEELSALAWICLCANVGMTLLVSVAYEYLRGLNIAGLSTLAPVAVHLATLAMFVTGMAQVYLNVALRQSDFSVNANTKVVQALTYSVASVGLGAGKVGVFGIIMGDFIGRVAVLGRTRLALPDRRIPKNTMVGDTHCGVAIPRISLFRPARRRGQFAGRNAYAGFDLCHIFGLRFRAIRSGRAQPFVACGPDYQFGFADIYCAGQSTRPRRRGLP